MLIPWAVRAAGLLFPMGSGKFSPCLSKKKALHEGIFQSPQAIRVHYVVFGELQVIKPSRVSTASSISRESHWIVLPEIFAKVNIDAAVGRSGTFGPVGAIGRDHMGAFLGASTIMYPNIGDLATLEALAVREALALSEDLSSQNIQVAPDCKVVVEEIKK